MHSEFAPDLSKTRMTIAQIRKYLRDLEEAREAARKKLEEYEASWELEKEEKELEKIEKQIDNL